MIYRFIHEDINRETQDRSTRRGWVVSSTPWPHFTPGKEPFDGELLYAERDRGQALCSEIGLKFACRQELISFCNDYTVVNDKRAQHSYQIKRKTDST